MKKRFFGFVVTLMVIAGQRGPVWAAESLADERYQVEIAAREGAFKVTEKANGRVILAGGRLSGTNGLARSVAFTDKQLGAGRGVEITYPDGNREVVGLYAGLPLVTFRSTFHNGGTAPVILNHVAGVSARVELGTPREELRTLGTGGLLAPGKNPGSYAFLAVADPKSRSGVVAGGRVRRRIRLRRGRRAPADRRRVGAVGAWRGRLARVGLRRASVEPRRFCYAPRPTARSGRSPCE